jgi:DNA-binding IclR family transcriptional regulator
MDALVAVRRAWTCCELLAAQPAGAAFSDLAAACGGLAPASMSRLLRVLTDEALIERAGTRGYRAGPRLRALLDRGGDPLARIQPLLIALATTTGESAALFVPVADGVRLLAKHECDERFRYMAIGGMNRHRQTHGAARLAAAWDGGEAALRQTGWLISRSDDQPGIARISAACLAADGSLRGIVTVSLVAVTLDATREASLTAAVRASAAAIAPHLPKDFA